MPTAAVDGGPKDALQHALELRVEVKQLLLMITRVQGKLKKHALPNRAIFYVSGGHYESHGSTGHPYNILAVTDS